MFMGFNLITRFEIGGEYENFLRECDVTRR